MPNIILFDDENWKSLKPLTFTRPVSLLRVGILTIKEKWEITMNGEASFIAQDYLSEKFPIHIAEDNLIINASLLPNDKIVALIKQLDQNEAILYQDELIAARMDRKQFDRLINDSDIEELVGMDLSDQEEIIQRIIHPHDIFTFNDQEIKADFELITKNRVSQVISETNKVISPENIFIEEGAQVECAILNASEGPIYIGKNAKIMEGSIVRGSFALCEGAVIKMGAKIYGQTTIGPYSKVGGEVGNSVILGYSNKGHDGYLGNSVLGEWCNLGADTNTSNLKNNYSEVRLWNYQENSFKKTGLQFCGLIMGDHSKCGINSMFNTGTVVGVSANIFGGGYPRNFVPSFAWGGHSGFSTYKLEKSLEVAEVVMKRRSVELTEFDQKILNHIFLSTSEYRTWEN